MKKPISCPAALVFIFCAGPVFAALPAGAAAANEEALKRQAAVEMVVNVSSVTYFEDASLVYGGYNCLNGVVASVKLNRKNAQGQDLKAARKAGDKVSILLDCQPDNVPFGPGQAATQLCSRAKKARRVKVWSGSVNFPVSRGKGCDRADSGFEILK